MVELGRNALLAKIDIKSAFWLTPGTRLNAIGLLWNGNGMLLIDTYLPFGTKANMAVDSDRQWYDCTTWMFFFWQGLPLALPNANYYWDNGFYQDPSHSLNVLLWDACGLAFFSLLIIARKSLYLETNSSYSTYISACAMIQVVYQCHVI